MKRLSRLYHTYTGLLQRLQSGSKRIVDIGVAKLAENDIKFLYYDGGNLNPDWVIMLRLHNSF